MVMLADFICPKCKKMFEDKVVFEGDEIICDECDTLCEKLVSLDATFRLKYDNKTDKVTWGAEGYAESQYYREYDKQAKNNIFVQGGKK